MTLNISDLTDILLIFSYNGSPSELTKLLTETTSIADAKSSLLNRLSKEKQSIIKLKQKNKNAQKNTKDEDIINDHKNQIKLYDEKLLKIDKIKKNLE